MVSSSLDSRIALDQHGAEDLLGRGDALLALPGVPGAVRLQGASTTEDDFNFALEVSRLAWPNEDEKPDPSLAEPEGGDEVDEAAQEAAETAAEPEAPASEWDEAYRELLDQMLRDGEIDEFQHAEMIAEEF